MLGDLVNGSESSRIILIEDSIEDSGRGLLACFISSLVKRLQDVHLVQLDHRCADMIKALPQEVQARLYKHSRQNDILNWNETTNVEVDTEVLKNIDSHHHSNKDEKSGIIIDSISPLMLHRTSPYTCKTLHKLADVENSDSRTESIVCLLHRDLHDSGSLSLVEHTATTVIRAVTSKSPSHQFCCRTLHKKPSGKIIRIEEHFNITEQFDIEDVTEIKSVKETINMETQPDPAANLTFNLSLTDKEKQARSQTVLPYTYSQERKDTTLNKSVGEGKIFYQPDEADDFDEEDPDDDLDI